MLVYNGKSIGVRDSPEDVLKHPPDVFKHLPDVINHHIWCNKTSS